MNMILTELLPEGKGKFLLLTCKILVYKSSLYKIKYVSFTMRIITETFLGLIQKTLMTL